MAGYNQTLIADYLFWAAAGMIAGFLSLGTLTYRLNRLEVPPMAVAVVSMVIFIGIQAALAAGYTGTPLLLWIAFGFFGTASTLSYAILSQAFPPGLAGRVNTAFNLLVFIAAFVMQWGLGAVIGLSPWTAAGGYAPVGYSAGRWTGGGVANHRAGLVLVRRGRFQTTRLNQEAIEALLGTSRPQRLQQPLMNSAKPAIAHDEHLGFRLSRV